METQPPVVPKNPLNFAPFEVELEKICSALNINANVKSAAKQLLVLSECHSFKFGEDPKFVVVSAVFITLQEQKIVISLSDILQTANLRYDSY